MMMTRALAALLAVCLAFSAAAQTYTGTIAAAGQYVEAVSAGATQATVSVSGQYATTGVNGGLFLQGLAPGSASWATIVRGDAFVRVPDGAQSAAVIGGATGLYVVSMSGYSRVRVAGLSAMSGTATVTIAPIGVTPASDPSAAATVSQMTQVSTSLATIASRSVPPTPSGRLPVDGSGTTQPVSVSGNVAVTGSFYQPTQPVSLASPVTVLGNFWQSTQPVSVAAPVAVTGSFYQSTQPVSGPMTDAQMRASPVSVTAASAMPVTGTFWQVTQPVSGTFWQATQPVSAAALPLPAGAATAANQTAVAASLASIDSKTAALGAVVKISPAPLPRTDSTAVCGATAAALMAANAVRSKLFLKNDTGIDVWVNLGGTAAVGAVVGSGNIKLPSGGSYFELNGYSGAISCIVGSGSAVVAAYQF